MDYLKSYSEKQKNIIDPGDNALRLVPVEPRHTLVGHHVVHGKDQFPGLQVEGDGHFTRERGDKGLDVLAVDKVFQGPFLWHH